MREASCLSHEGIWRGREAVSLTGEAPSPRDRANCLDGQTLWLMAEMNNLKAVHLSLSDRVSVERRVPVRRFQRTRMTCQVRTRESARGVLR